MRTKNEKVKDDKHRMDGTRVVHKAVASRDDRWFDRINTAFLIGVVLVIGYPLWFVLIASISDPQAVESGKVWIWPVDFTIDGYLRDRKSTRLNSSHVAISYDPFCFKKYQINDMFCV